MRKKIAFSRKKNARAPLPPPLSLSLSLSLFCALPTQRNSVGILGLARKEHKSGSLDDVGSAPASPEKKVFDEIRDYLLRRGTRGVKTLFQRRVKYGRAREPPSFFRRLSLLSAPSNLPPLRPPLLALSHPREKAPIPRKISARPGKLCSRAFYTFSRAPAHSFYASTNAAIRGRERERDRKRDS